jgi:uncharacterized protein
MACDGVWHEYGHDVSVIIPVKIPDDARRMASRLRQGLSAEAVYLFGSHARGMAGRDSDLDLAVIVPESSESRYQRSVRARGLVGDIHVAKDIVVFTRREWQEEYPVAGSLANAVARDGVRLDV